ncbi:hypothetical protein DITRI_Ditri06bG0153200 [Diplodiscus trichospermus]
MGSSRFLLFYSVLLSLATLTLSLHDPYLQCRCSQTSGNYTANSTFQANLNRIVSQFSLTEFKYGFFNLSAGESPDKVYAMALCRADVDQDGCNSCIKDTSTELEQRCPSYKEAIAWSEFCLVRYANRNIYGRPEVENASVACLYNTAIAPNPDEFYDTILELLSDLRRKAAAGDPLLKYAAGNATIFNSQMVYAMVQCTPDMDEQNCINCLTYARRRLRNCCRDNIGCRVYRPTCTLRFESASFFNQTAVPPPPLPPTTTTSPPTGESGNNTTQTIVIVVASVIGGLILIIISICIFMRRRGLETPKIVEKHINHNSQEVQLLEFGGSFGDDYSNENFQGESGVRSKEFPSIQLNILQAATEQFCDENKLGEGGFGPVYKGKLVDGKEIAVKRLSRTSGQGLLEFKNEVMLIAKLQHRNLVRLVGCCLEQNEKLLVYEYMPNKSLDAFLFDSSIGVQLDWQKRLSIINGIARGILYLHEDSRLKIIHRDLKASNVLLDHEMNPKISDFGMARIFGGNQSEANTNRVVGTYGYMAPEYAMEGLFSVKSDVFSFGVLLLEIVSGKRNNGFHLWESGESLLTFAWKLWSKGRGMELIDPRIDQSCVATEVLKCIHIGLLCVQEDPADRPTMSSVVVMLAIETITLPLPNEPAFSIGRIVAEATQSTSNDGICSVNEATVSNVSPR